MVVVGGCVPTIYSQVIAGTAGFRSEVRKMYFDSITTSGRNMPNAILVVWIVAGVVR